MRSKLPFLVLASFAIFWVGFFAISSPIFGGTDVFIFRDASCNCAAHLGFVTSSAPTHPAYIPPVVFADYTPGTLLAFVPAARIFGCKPYTDTYVELLLLAIIAWFVVAFIPDDERHRNQRLLASLLAGITLPVGLFETAPDRPEPLALALFFTLLMLWKRVSSGWARGVIVGLSGSLFLVHPYLGIAAYWLFLLIVVCSPRITDKAKIVLASFVVVAASVLAWVLILSHADASAIHRFMEHAMSAKSGAGVVLKGNGGHAGLLHSYLAALKMYTDSSNRLRIIPITVLLVSFVILGVATGRVSETSGRRTAFITLLVIFTIVVLFPATIFSGQINYFIASEALLFGAVAVGGYTLSDEIRRGRTLIVIVGLCAVASLPNLLIQVLRSVETRSSFERAVAQEKRVKQIFLARGLSEPRILVDSSHYFIYKPDFDYLYNVSYFQPDDLVNGFDGLVRCYVTRLAFSRSELTWDKPFHQDDWELIDGDSYPETISLFGHRLMRRNWTWSCDVYARKGPRH